MRGWLRNNRLFYFIKSCARIVRTPEMAIQSLYVYKLPVAREVWVYAPNSICQKKSPLEVGSTIAARDRDRKQAEVVSFPIANQKSD